MSETSTGVTFACRPPSATGRTQTALGDAPIVQTKTSLEVVKLIHA